MFLDFISQKLLECGLVWQLQHIGGNKQAVIHACYGVFQHLLTFAGAEQDANRRIVAFVHLMVRAAVLFSGTMEASSFLGSLLTPLRK